MRGKETLIEKMKELNKKLQERLNEMVLTGHLFRSTVSGEQIWNAYLEGFGKDPVYRDPSSSVHNCNLCHSFIKRYGNIIAFNDDLELMTLWDIEAPEEYKGSVKKIQELLGRGGIQDIFVETFDWLNSMNYEKTKKNMTWFRLGLESNVKVYTEEDAEKYPLAGIKKGDIKTFTHLSLQIPDEFVDKSGKSRETIMTEPRQRAQVFKRGLEEIPLDTMYLIRDLEAQGSLLNGISYKHFVLGAIKAKEEYDKITDPFKREAYIWRGASSLGVVAGFRNTAIGTLMVELSQGKELNAAVQAFNKMVDPANYMKASAPITKKQIQEAEMFVEENGYAESFERRCATIEDINVSDILHSNVSAAEVKTKVSVFSSITSTKPSRHKKSEFDGVQEVPIEKFMSEILPTCTSVEVFLQNKHKGNFVNLLTSKNKESKGIFKWLNNFSWTYSGNLAGKSLIAQAVQKAGGCIDAPFRCSIIWNEKKDAMHTDLDNHCIETVDGRTNEIYYGQFREKSSGGQGITSPGGGILDIDITNPSVQCSGGPAVENIYFKTFRDGTYQFVVHNYNGGENIGARAEIYLNGVTHQYTIPHRIMQRNPIVLATFTIKGGEAVKIDQSKYYVGEGEEQPMKMWGLDTGEFHKVSLLCLSPNYWEGNGVGNKHYFFMLEGAQNPDEIRSIHNEFLNDDLRAHRKVMEVLGSTLKVESTKGQLAGLGFNSTVHDEVILRLGGSHKRVIKVKI